jgi:hypothetical protein
MADKEIKKPQAHRKVIARIPFFDVPLGRQFKAGEEIVGWDEARIKHYVERGTVQIVSAVQPEEVK